MKFFRGLLYSLGDIEDISRPRRDTKFLFKVLNNGQTGEIFFNTR